MKTEHKYHECTCGEGPCMFCGGGLLLCNVCRGMEGSLTTDCCGRRITDEEEYKIYNEGSLDFVDGEWIEK